MLTYVAFAPALYARFFLLYGKPTQEDYKELPAQTDQRKYSIDGLDPIIYKGQDLYKLWGWAFLTVDPSKPPEMYVRKIVLTSGSRHYYFPTTSAQRPDVQKMFKDHINMNLIKSGFLTLIAKDFIWPGEYSIGIIFRDKLCGCDYYLTTSKVIVRTANQLQMRKAKSTP